MDVETMEGYLEQAACPEPVRAQVEQLVSNGHGAEGLPLLAGHRARLLGELHEVDRRLMCLDRVIADISAASR